MSSRFFARGNIDVTSCFAKGVAQAFVLSLLKGGNVLRITGLTLGLVLGLAAGNLAAQEWAEKMFKTTEHDFGTVARGADTVYRFEVTNIYKQDITLTNVRSSCGCTSPSIENPVIKTHEKAYVVARFNTRTFVGQKGATLTVSFGGQFPAEVQLHVHGNIRSDVVFNPGAIEFGEISEGDAAEKHVAVEYAGRADWKIVDVTNDNDNFEVELLESQRAAGRVSYNLVVRLKPDVPAGYVKDQLTVITNDTRAENQRIPLFVSGHVRPEFSVTPELLVLGEVEPGKETTRKIVVRGREPFKITDVSCGEDCLRFNHDDQLKTVHFVEVTFRAGEAPGKIETPITITTDHAGRGAKLMASAVVVAKPVVPAEAADEAAEGASDAAASTAPTANDEVVTASAQ
jgi:hypothetical protein